MSRFAAVISAFLLVSPVVAEQILYIGTPDGRLLTAQGRQAIMHSQSTPTVLTGFFGYGTIRLNAQCLTSSKVGADLVWQNCVQGNSSQVWRLQRKRLSSLSGICAELGDQFSSASAGVKAMTCANKPEQRWESYGKILARVALKEVADESVRAAIEDFARNSPAGARLELNTEQLAVLPSELVVANQSVIAAGRSSLVYRLP